MVQKLAVAFIHKRHRFLSFCQVLWRALDRFHRMIIFLNLFASTSLDYPSSDDPRSNLRCGCLFCSISPLILSSSSLDPAIALYIETSGNKVDDIVKPQIDLNEFLQQLGVLKGDEDQPSSSNSAAVSNLTEIESSSFKDDGFGELTEKCFDWDSLSEIGGTNDDTHLGDEDSSIFFDAHDSHEDLLFPPSIF